MTTRRNTRAFTLIELLVVIAIIALLISLLLPGLAQARDLARQMVCGGLLRNFGQAQASYMATFKDHYAATITSGLSYISNDRSASRSLLGDTGPTTPMTINDWFSPTMGDSVNAPNNRARRMQLFLNKYGCGSVRLNNDSIYSQQGDTTDEGDFETVQSEQAYKAISYLMPAAFSLYSNANISIGILRLGSAARMQFNTPVNAPRGFSARLDQVGNQSRKVMIADGTRYLASENGGLTLDFDIDQSPRFYGSFIDPGPILDVSAAYGRTASGSASGQGWKISFRHARGNALNAVFFDGHVESITRERAYEDASLWYPTGSIFTGGQATREAAAKYAQRPQVD
jgi:prepilin-type N-terminal cleavage/methylation domain-containing protein/prepilin-type processing-associated H-X9-DG protein